MLYMLIYIFTTLKELGMPENDSKVDQHIQKLEHFQKNENEFNFKEDLSVYFKIILESIEEIQVRIVAMRI